MPRNGSRVYRLPAVYQATTGQTITAIQHNSPLTDIAADLNAARPVTCGGTGAQTAADARANLGLVIGTNVDRVPAGVIVMWSGAANAIPAGWKLCDGTNSTPDLRNRFIVGAGDDYDPDDTGGAASVTLTTSEIPSHSHGNGSLTAASAGAHSHPIGVYEDTNSVVDGKLAQGRGSRLTSASTDSAGAHTHTITGSTSSAGSGGAHENRPPYYALCFIMRS